MDTRAAAEVLATSLRLGLTSFGGPIAHVGYQRTAFVVRRRWLDEASFANLVALCQALPGPASSQLGIAVGALRAGYLGALAAWIGFTLPSAMAMAALGMLVAGGGMPDGGPLAGAVAGLKVAAVAVVAQAVAAMAVRLTPDLPRIAMAVAAVLVALLIPGQVAQLALIAAGAAIGRVLLAPRPVGPAEPASAAPPDAGTPSPVGRRGAVALASALVLLLAGLPAAATLTGAPGLGLLDAIARAGALVFGGGHVVLPLLQTGVVDPGWVDRDLFVVGYGAAQAVPGPLFTFASYLGAVATVGPGGAAGAGLATLAIFMPSGLLVLAVLPAWNAFRRRPGAQAALAGVSAAVVGILGAALVTPVGTSAITDARSAVLATAGAVVLWWGRVPPVFVVAAIATAMAAAG